MDESGVDTRASGMSNPVRSDDASGRSAAGRSVSIAVAPKAKARPRMSKSGHVYTPKDTVSYEKYIREQWQQHNPDDPYENAVAVMIRFHFKRPQKDYLRGTLRESAPKHVVKTPDLDNIEKAVLDALNGCAYTDDKQVVRKYTEKLWGHENLITITVLPLEE